jgi:glycosyltransferase involved in cell wall biosynthesis
MMADSGERTRILFVQPWTGPYGSESSLYLLIKNLNREEFSPMVVLPDKGPLREKLQAIDVPISISPLKPWFADDDSVEGVLRWLEDLPERLEGIVELIHRWDIEIVHSNVADIFEGAFAARLTGRPHICTVRNNRFAETWVANFISLPNAYAVISSLSNAIVPVSNAVKDAMSPYSDPLKLRVIPNGIEATSAQRDVQRPRSEPHRSDSKNPQGPRICSFGRIAVQKGYELLIDAAALVVKSFPTARFSVYGAIQDEPLGQRLLGRVDQLGLGENVSFEGHTDSVQEELHAMDLLVISSIEEGSPRVALEAMAAAKPIVSTRCGGPEEIIIHGETGYLVPQDDSESLAEAIIKVLEDPETARQMGSKGLERVRRHFDARRVSEQYEALYREVLKDRPAGPPPAEEGMALMIGAVISSLGKYGEELDGMVNKLENLKSFEAIVKNTLAYKAYKAARSLRQRL